MEAEEECIVALLHDTVEDTSITFEELEKEFSSEIIEALKLLTHDKSVDYMEYIKTLKNNPIAKKVKIADIKHNSDKTRLEYLESKHIEKHNKYKEALIILEE